MFALEAIFGTPARELFAGIYADAEQQTLGRARALIPRLSEHRERPHVQRKLARLQTIVGDLPGNGDPNRSPR